MPQKPWNIATVLKSLLFADMHVMSSSMRVTVEHCVVLCTTSASWTLAQLLPPLVESQRKCAVTVACCDALLCPRRTPLVVNATTADVAYKKQAAAERAAAMEHDVVAERRAAIAKRKMEDDDDNEDMKDKTVADDREKPVETVDMNTLVEQAEEPQHQSMQHEEAEEQDKNEAKEATVVINKQADTQEKTSEKSDGDANEDDDLMIDINAEPDADDIEDDD